MGLLKSRSQVPSSLKTHTSIAHGDNINKTPLINVLERGMSVAVSRRPILTASVIL